MDLAYLITPHAFRREDSLRGGNHRWSLLETTTSPIRLLEIGGSSLRGVNCAYSLRFSPLSLLLVCLLQHLPQLHLLVGATTGLLKVASRHFDKRSFNRTSRHWEFHLPIKVFVAIPILSAKSS